MRRRSSLGGSDDRASRVSERFTNPFAPLSLSSEAVSGLEALAQTLVARNVDAYERHLHGGAQVDKTRWKLLYERGGLRSYAERGSADSSFGFGAAFGAAAGHLDRPVLTQSSRASVPSVLVLGSIEGELDDTMYGFMCPTLDQMRVKTSYVKDGLARGSVLATLVSPTVEDPFTSVAVKWMEKGQPAHARAVVKNRDYVYLEATGVEYLRNGERVGYQVVHSIQFPETPMKKIKWAIRQRYRSASVDSQTALAQDSRVDGPCVTCGKKRSAFSSLVATAARRMTTGKNFKWRRRCKLCERYVCPDCRSLHKLTFVLPDHRLVQQQVALCTDCRGNALSVKAVDVARDELKRRRSSLYEWRDTYATSTSSNPVAIDELN
ncbi:hypothetical protein PRIC1_003028 [Phytophthora ramorum]